MTYLATQSGTQLYYEQHGDSGPVVVLLPGLGATTRFWAAQVRTLRKYCRVYTLDFPGHGRSGRLKRYKLNSIAEDVNVWLQELDIQQANLVGVSIGCSVALILAEQHPARVQKLVLEGPIGGYCPGWNICGWRDWLAFYVLPVLLQISFSLFGRQATAHWVNTFGVKTKRNTKTLDTIQKQTDFKAIRDLLRDSAYAPYISHLHSIEAPVLLVRGQDDPMPRRFTEYIRRHLKKVTYTEVPGTRHLVALEKPSVFNRLILDFLEIEVKG